MSEYFVALALPVSAHADADLHVNVFISPKLSGAAGATLADFPLFQAWGEFARSGLDLTLVDQNGPMATTLDTSAVEPALWPRVFPGTLSVRINEVPKWQGRDWRTFPAKDAAEIAKAVHLATVVADPTTPVRPSAHPLIRPIWEYVRESKALQLPKRGNQLDWPVYDERLLTQHLDRGLRRGAAGATTGTAKPYNYGASASAAGPATLQSALQDLHRVRRYYERPESQSPTQAVPDPPQPVKVLEPPQPEFHERVAAIGDHRELLLRLGLVIPLKGDPARLRKSEWLAVQVGPSSRRPDAAAACRAMPVAVRALADGSLVTRANPTAPPMWQDGQLTLGESSVFDVVDIDIDGSAIKTERFLTTLPRLALAELRQEPVDAATPALRATGLTVTRRQQAEGAIRQLKSQEGWEQALANAVPPSQQRPLHTADVTRGMRVEVWDQTARRWFSLHARDTTLRLHDDVIYRDVRNEGFIQGTNATQTPGVAASAIHVHEALFGWDGWSLSAPRPGRRVRGDVGDSPGGGSRIDENVVEAEEPWSGREPHPFRFTHTIARGTLPRLRYGREYAFRAWTVDLAGGVRPHALGPSPLAPDAVLPLLRSTAVGALLAEQGVRDQFGGVGGVHEALHRAAGAREDGPFVFLESSAPERDTATSAGAGEPASNRLLRQVDTDTLQTVAQAVGLGGAARSTAARKQTLGLLRAASPGAWLESDLPRASATRLAASRASQVRSVFRSASIERKQPISCSTLVTDLSRLSDLVASQLGHAAGTASPVPDPGSIQQALKTVTPLRPFLRWEPVPPPALVPLKAYTEAESLRVLVVRSGVTQDPGTLDVTVSPPATVSQRHLAPPKTSQVQAELHGVFDSGIDTADTPDAAAQSRREMLAIALREDGSFFDRSVPHPTDPTGAASPLPGVRLLPEPVNGDHFNPHAPAHPLKVLPPAAGVDAALVLNKGDAPAPGQYIVHDTQQLTLPYLPDPLARGVSLVFHEAGAGRVIAFPWGTEGITADYPGAWPHPQPFLLTLAGGAQLDGRIDAHRIDIALPAGDVQRLRLSSALPKARLDWLGVWRSLAPSITGDPVAREAAADGLLWGLSPSEPVTLVHAVPRPVQAPRPTTVRVLRAPGSTLAALFGGLEVHGPSTESVSASARWTDTVDDLALPAPVQRDATLAAFTTKVLPHESIVPLWVGDQMLDAPGWENVWLHAALHTFPDTRHHRVHYRFRATTRFREYFSPDALAPDPSDPLDDGMSVVSAELEIAVPSTVAPEPPKVHSVLPLFRWSDGEEPEQPFGRRHTRGAGMRIYLERGWNSSGDGELLAVLLAPGGSDTAGYPPPPNPAEGFEYVSQWGSDPAWIAPGVEKRPLQLLDFDSGLALSRIDDRHRPGFPAAPVAALPLPLPPKKDNPAQPSSVPVMALGYLPQYSEERGLWYVDIAFSPRATFWPFLRLALARYQPESVAGKHLSLPVRADFVQIAPERTASVSRTDDRHVRVVVSGYTGHRGGRAREWAAAVAQNRTVVARLQEFDPAIGGDLGWTTRDVVELEIRGHGENIAEVVWVGELSSQVSIQARTPLAENAESPPVARFRVRIEEWEQFEGDPPPRADIPKYGAGTIWQGRLVYADDLLL